MEKFLPLNSVDHIINNSSDQIPNLATPWSSYVKLISFNPSKAPGPDIPNCIFKDFADILAHPVSVLLNRSFQHQKLAGVWKLANIIPIPKDNPVTDINQHLGPISLTCSLSQLAKEFIIENLRVFLFDYRKAFDLIDHAILVNKICQLPIPSFLC